MTTGNKVKVVDRKYGHSFKIGEILTVKRKPIYRNSLYCTNIQGKEGWVRHEEWEKITE